MIRSTSWILCLIWMTNAIGAYAGVLKRQDRDPPYVSTMPRGKIYVAVKQKKTWDQARATCQKLGGDLAQIRTIEDQARVAEFLDDNFYTGTSAEWWIGAKRDGKESGRIVEGSWKWVNGDKVSKDIAYHWHMQNLHDNENCFSIHKYWGAAFCAGKCTNAWEFVCERYVVLTIGKTSLI